MMRDVVVGAVLAVMELRILLKLSRYYYQVQPAFLILMMMLKRNMSDCKNCDVRSLLITKVPNRKSNLYHS